MNPLARISPGRAWCVLAEGCVSWLDKRCLLVVAGCVSWWGRRYLLMGKSVFPDGSGSVSSVVGQGVSPSEAGGVRIVYWEISY
jgi:hypothetical protein